MFLLFLIGSLLCAFVLGLILGTKYGARWWFLLCGGRDDEPRGKLNG